MYGKIKIAPLFITLLLLLLPVSALAGTTTYQYDDLHRLTRVDRPDGTSTVYNYDDFGNRTSKTVTVPAPVAAFTALPTSGPAPLAVSFLDQSTGTVTAWAWDFDNNGSTDSTEQNPSHTYSAEGTYTAKLTVTGPGGSDFTTDIITATAPVVDSDGDDLPDWWEEQYFPGDLTVLNRNGDYDHDGYSNYQEYLNGTNPTIKDAPGGPDYHPPGSNALPGILMLLLDNT